MELEGKVAVVTGAGSGIGAACARAFAARGARVVATDKNADAVRAVARAIGALAVPCDVAKESEIDALVAEAERGVGPIDVFFNNAGVATGGDPLTTPLEVWEAQWRVNVMSHVYAVRAVLPGMLARGSGYLLHTASMAGILTSHGNLTYAVTKHAVVGLAEWLAITHGDKGIKVSVLCPQAVRTAMTAGNPDGVASIDGMIEPEVVAEACVRAIEAEDFLVLPHPEVLEYMRRKTGDYNRWIGGMRKLNRRFGG